MRRPTVGVIGAGPWGLSLAAAAARSGGDTLLFSRRAAASELPPGVRAARDFAELGREARLIIVAVPSAVAPKVGRELGDHIDGRHLVVHGVRGLVGDGLATVSDVLRSESPARRVGALGGPALAADLAASRPTVLVCGSHYPEVNEAATAALSSDSVRVYTTRDLRGLEWASALVGCIAIGLGFCQRIGLGPGILAALTSQAVHEAARIIEAAGGEPRTMMGLGGYGDLLACTAQPERPEVLLGAALAERKSLEKAMAEAKLRVEAVDLIPRISAWATTRRVHTPILASMARTLFSEEPPSQIVHQLMTTPMEAAP